MLVTLPLTITTTYSTIITSIQIVVHTKLSDLQILNCTLIQMHVKLH